MKHFDIIIIGGGASGMMCAIASKEKNPDKSVAIIEKQNRIGRKILSTGNGRCNLLNMNCSENNYNGSFSKNINTVLKNNSPEIILKYFKKLGLLAKEENEGRVYPVSNHASAVLDVLRFKIESLRIEVKCEEAVKNIKKLDNGFKILTDKNNYSSEKVVVSSGTPASPKLGGDGDMLNILGELGHKTVPFYPALCPLKVKSNILPSLKGLRVSGEVSLFDGNSLIHTENGEIQFNEGSISGICVFNLSNRLNNVKNPYIRINLLPAVKDAKELINNNTDRFKYRKCEDLFTGIFQKKLSLAILKEAGIKPSINISTLKNEDSNRIARIIKDWKFEVIGTESFYKAQVSGGGISGENTKPETMESKLVNNLYISGEIIDIIGDCGGYNLYFAFASGKTIGENL